MSAHRDPALGELLDAIDAAPREPSVAAFVDLDAVLVAHGGDGDLAEWAGREPQELIDAGAKRYRKGEAAGLSYEVWGLVKAHQRCGHTVVLVASATRDRMLPVAGELEVEHALCSEAEVDQGRLTGRVTAPALRGTAKREAVERFAAAHGIDLDASYAYAAGGEDVPVLTAVGEPIALHPDEGLRREAGERGWRTIATFDREAGALGVARTVASYGAFLASSGVGIAAGLLAGRRRAGVDVMSRMFGTIAPPLAGIHIDVQGAEHAREHRPAVFMINHQSHLVDAIVTFHLLRDGFTVVAKKEVRAIPAIGHATWLADWAYVDRVGDKAQARAAVADAVDKLREGVSVILAPEGTRSLGPSPGPFKKGGFYIAREAGVPVVPIVMRNTGELMWRAGKALKGGTVEVVVLPPIFCDWSDEEFGERVAEVRQRFVDTLEAWPTR